MNRHLRSGSRTNRDRRDQAFARSIIAEATRIYNKHVAPTDIEVCRDCFGTGETEQHVTDGITRMLPCPECNGKGYY
jgi:hypothetical protein